MEMLTAVVEKIMMVDTALPELIQRFSEWACHQPL
jgi:hypothetical protein